MLLNSYRMINKMSIIKNKIVLFSINRYFLLAIQFAQGIIVAKVLGPYYFGIWGFINLILQYLSYSSLGIQYAVNIELSTHPKDEKKRIEKIIGSSILINILISVLVIAVVFIYKIALSNIHSNYRVEDYLILLSFITVTVNFNQTFMNIYRSYGYLGRIGFTEFIITFSSFLCLFFYFSEKLILILLIINSFNN